VLRPDTLQLLTAPDVGELVEAFLSVPPPETLSQAALETLAIVTYEQPVCAQTSRRFAGPTATALSTR
jgi:chromosome segregation and condensation protein ScpB